MSGAKRYAVLSRGAMVVLIGHLILLLGASSLPCLAQTPMTLLQQAQAAHVRGTMPADITITGTTTDERGVASPLTIAIKGKDKIRYEVGTGATKVITIFNSNQGWFADRLPSSNSARTHQRSPANRISRSRFIG